jgi:hypothetical protein
MVSGDDLASNQSIDILIPEVVEQLAPKSAEPLKTSLSHLMKYYLTGFPMG